MHTQVLKLITVSFLRNARNTTLMSENEAEQSKLCFVQLLSAIGVAPTVKKGWITNPREWRHYCDQQAWLLRQTVAIDQSKRHPSLETWGVAQFNQSVRVSFTMKHHTNFMDNGLLSPKEALGNCTFFCAINVVITNLSSLSRFLYDRWAWHCERI